MAELTILSYIELGRCTRPAATSFAISYLLCSQMVSSLSLFWVKLEQSITSSSFCLGLLLQKNIWSSNYIILSLLTSFLWKQIFKITPTNHFYFITNFGEKRIPITNPSNGFNSRRKLYTYHILLNHRIFLTL